MTSNRSTEGAGALARGQGTELSARQRVQLREQLTRQWQATVGRITTLSVRLHDVTEGQLDAGGEGRAGQPGTVAALTRLRWELTEVEAALGRLDGDGYGVCAACTAPIPFERLETQPQARFCVRCRPGGGR